MARTGRPATSDMLAPGVRAKLMKGPPGCPNSAAGIGASCIVCCGCGCEGGCCSCGCCGCGCGPEAAVGVVLRW